MAEAPLVPYKERGCKKIINEDQFWIGSLCVKKEYHPLTSLRAATFYYFGHLAHRDTTLSLNLFHDPGNPDTISSTTIMNQGSSWYTGHENEAQVFFEKKLYLPLQVPSIVLKFNFSKDERYNMGEHTQYDDLNGSSFIMEI